MGRLPLIRIRSDEAGFALIEVMVSAMVLLTAAVGVFTAFDSSTRATAQERHRARANDLAQSDLERIRSLPYACPITSPSCTYSIVSLTTPQTRTVTQDGTDYTIVSKAQFLTETPTTSTCVTGPDSRDYLQISSTVTWPGMGSRPPVAAASAVSPPSGSVVPGTGSLLVTVVDSRSAGMPGVALSGSGPAGFTGTTGASGCVLWRNLPAGTYSMSLAGAASGTVDKDGNPVGPQTVSIVSQGTNTVNLMYDRPGSITNITLQTRRYGDNALVSTLPSGQQVTTDQVIVFNSGMTVAKRLGTAGTEAATFSATGLFPFTSAYSAYAGTCDPNGAGGGASVANVTVPPGGSQSPAAPIQLPALHLTVHDGTDALQPGNPVAGATATVTDVDAGCQSYMRTFTTDASGHLPNPGLPWGTYQVCAKATFGGQTRRNYVRTGLVNPPIESVPVQNLSAGMVRDVYLGTQASGVTQGNGANCP